MPKYRPKTPEVDAVQFIPDRPSIEYPDWARRLFFSDMFIHVDGKDDLTFILMRKHKYPAEVHAGNWIVNCNHDINLCEVYSDEEFHQYYEEVKESEDSHE